MMSGSARIQSSQEQDQIQSATTKPPRFIKHGCGLCLVQLVAPSAAGWSCLLVATEPLAPVVVESRQAGPKPTRPSEGNLLGGMP